MIAAVLRIWSASAFIAWVMLVAFVVGMASSDSSHGANAPGGGLEQRRDHPVTTVEQVSRGVMCPTCDATLDQSDSPAADSMRAWIREAVAAGWSEREIRDGLVEQYDGDQSVLAVPKSTGIGIGAWLAPALIVFAMLVVGVLLPRRWRRGRRMRSGQASSEASSQS